MNSDVPVVAPSPIRRSRLHELVANRLEYLIQSGALKPGDRLPSERDLMAAFSIGRPAVREAFLALHNKGLITTENGRRASVCFPNIDRVFNGLDAVVGLILNDSSNLKHLFDARVFLEAAMARNAAIAIDDIQLDALNGALTANKLAIGNRAAFVETDIEFHRILFTISPNPVFEAVHKALVSWLTDRWSQIHRDTSTETLAYKGHLQIFRAIRKRDANAAEAAMRNHLALSWAIWTRHLPELKKMKPR
jgi:GntR family transcriptional regulator, sialic acid-inducible nan operon repressor